MIVHALPQWTRRQLCLTGLRDQDEHIGGGRGIPPRRRPQQYGERRQEVTVARTGKFLIKAGRGGKTHFVLVATNGRVVATSETYESKDSCLKGVAAVKRLAADAAVVEEAPASTVQRGRKTAAPPKPAAASF
jgi:uncharacterized protein YegP (UPF0339 family)